MKFVIRKCHRQILTFSTSSCQIDKILFLYSIRLIGFCTCIEWELVGVYNIHLPKCFFCYFLCFSSFSLTHVKLFIHSGKLFYFTLSLYKNKYIQAKMATKCDKSVICWIELHLSFGLLCTSFFFSFHITFH